MASPYSTRILKDNTFINTKYLPAAGATNNSDVMDLESVLASPECKFGIEVAVGAAANHTDNTKTILLDIYDSANNLTFAISSPMIRCQLPGVASTGSAATTYRFRPPHNLRRYVRFLQTVPSGAGDNTGVLVTYALIF